MVVAQCYYMQLHCIIFYYSWHSSLSANYLFIIAPWHHMASNLNCNYIQRQSFSAWQIFVR